MFIAGAIAPPLTEWANFYVIVGSSAGALTGLQFVVIALIAESEFTSGMQEIRAFGTPTIVHFCTALLISAVISAPWHVLANTAVALGLLGAAGTLYSLNVTRHARRQNGYVPDLGDWMWYAIIPVLTHVALLASAIALPWHSSCSMFVIAAITLAFMFIGIHNAWDAITYMAITHGRKRKKPEE